MKDKLFVIKIGGNIIDDEKKLNFFLKDFAQLKENKILIHGGGKIATKLSTDLGVNTQMIDGRRITSLENLEIVTMVYAGLISKNIVAKLQALQCNAIGLSGADGNSILAKKRAIEPVDFGFVGEVQKINIDLINTLILGNIVPVFNAISHDGNGQLLNTNADTIASEIAVALCTFFEVDLIYCFEKLGVLMDVENPLSVISEISSKKFIELKDSKIINEGMIPKLNNGFNALRNKVTKVIIGNEEILKEGNNLFTSLKI